MQLLAISLKTYLIKNEKYQKILVIERGSATCLPTETEIQIRFL